MKIVFLDDIGSQNSLKNMISIAIQISLEYPYRNFLMSVDRVDGGIQRYFKPKIGQKVAEDHSTKRPKGIEYLVKRQIQGMLGKRDFEEAFISVMDYHLYYLPSDEETNDQSLEYKLHMSTELAHQLEVYGDIVFINGGSYMNAWSSGLIEAADLVVISVGYSDENLEKLFMEMAAATREKSIFILSQCIKDYIGEKKIKNNLRIRDSQIGIMPENTQYTGAYLKGKASEFLLKNNRLPANIECRGFVKDLRDMTRGIMRELGLV